MHHSVAAFMDHLRTERQASVHTLRSYEDDLALYSSYLAEVQGTAADPTAVDSVRLRRYSAWLTGRGYAPSTVARRLASLRSFFRFLRREGLVASDPSAGLRNPKQARRLPRLLRVDEVIRLLEGVPVDTAPGIRDRAMLETLYGGGLRVGELVALNVSGPRCRSGVAAGPRERTPRATRSDWCDGGGVAEALGSASAAESLPGARLVPQPARDPVNGAERQVDCWRGTYCEPDWSTRPVLTRCGIVSRPTCWIAVPTSGASRSYSAIAT